MRKSDLKRDSQEQLRLALREFIDHADEVLFEGNMDHAERMLDAYVAMRVLVGKEAVDALRRQYDLSPLPEPTKTLPFAIPCKLEIVHHQQPQETQNHGE